MKILLALPFMQEDTGKQCVDVDRGDSAVSKFTTDSGVGLDSGEAPTLPGAVHRKLPPLAGRSRCKCLSMTLLGDSPCAG